MLKLLLKLYHIRLLTPMGLYRIIRAIFSEGSNLMTLLKIAVAIHPKRNAIVEESDSVSYRQLWEQSSKLAQLLQSKYKIAANQKVAIACHNHAAHLKAIFAVSRLGAHVYLLNPEMRWEQFNVLQEKHLFDFIIYDLDIESIVLELAIKSIPSYHPTADCIDSLSKAPNQGTFRLKRSSSGKLVVLTGGTTGQPKSAARKPSIFDFLSPFFALLREVELDRFQSVFIATPIYHGFGVASVFMAMTLGAEIHLSAGFEAKKACQLIITRKIEVVTLVPLMLQRMLQADNQALTPLKRIIAGGAPLSTALAAQTLEQLGAVLYNLYGTSEAGFCIIATPEDLQNTPNSIGKAVQGVKIRILDEQENCLPIGKVGNIAIQSSWSINKKTWVTTGDLGYLDVKGRVFLCGRIDDMIVSGGENVYPIELENILSQHPEIEQVAVIGVPDVEFGQRLKAFVVVSPHSSLNVQDLFAWLKNRVARYQMPVAIDFRDALPLTNLDKVDKRRLLR